MKNTNIEKTDAHEALEALKHCDIENQQRLRSPIGFIFVAAFSVALLTTSICAARHDNNWMLGVFAAFALYLFSWFLHLQIVKLKGIKHRIIPKTPSGWKLTLGIALFVAVSTFAGRQISESGYEWVSFLTGAVNGVFLFFAIYKFPTNDSVSRGL